MNLFPHVVEGSSGKFTRLFLLFRFDLFSTQLSCSCHSLAELECAPRFRYVTLSPVYPSISKPGYDPQPFAGFLKGKMPAPNVIALGGVTPETYPELREAGFAGAARLGDVWKPFVNNK